MIDCKKKRKLPVVQMKLFMDNHGIIIKSFPGNTLDHLPLRSALEKNINAL